MRVSVHASVSPRADDVRPASKSALEQARQMCTATANATSEGAAAMNAVMGAPAASTFKSGTGTPAKDQPASQPATWREASGRGVGNESYQFGDLSRSAMRWWTHE